VEIDAADMPGWYELGIPDAALATGADFVGIQLKGATDMAQLNLEIQLTDTDVNDGTGGGISRLDAAVTTRSSHSATDVTRALQPQINQAFPNIEVLMVLASDHVTPATGLTVTGQRSIDGGAFTGVSGTIAEVGSGIYQFDAIAADLNGSIITFRFSSGTADDTFLTLKTTT